MPLDSTLGQMARPIHELVTLRDGDPQLFLHRLWIEAGVVRHLNRAGGSGEVAG